MNKNYFKMMFRCALASFGVLVAATVFDIPPLVATVGAMLPLIYYHWGFLRPQAKSGLSQTAIDSVYYFGFLVTVAALGISAISIALRGDGANLSTVVFQFGIGLLATGYAVFARMHLSSASAQVEEASPEALMDRYVKRSVELVSNIEMASEQLSQFSATLISKTTETAETARLAAERTMLDAAKVFESEIKSTLAMARDGLTTIRGLVNETSFTAEREELLQSMKATVEVTTVLNLALSELAGRSQQSAQAAQETSASSVKLNSSLNDFAGQVRVFGGENGVFATVSQSMSATTETISTYNSLMAGALAGLSELAGAVADTGPTFKSMRTLTKKASEQLDGLAESSAKLDTAAENLMGAALSSDALSAGLGKVAAALVPLSDTAETLTKRFDSAGTVTARLTDSLAQLPEQTANVKNLSDEVADSLDHICEVIEDAVKHSSALAKNTEGTAKAIEAAAKLLASAATLESTVSKLEQRFGGFSDSVVETQKALTASSNNIAASVARSADSLESDVKRSGKAASLLTERLTQVAQNIIDRTKQTETVG